MEQSLDSANGERKVRGRHRKTLSNNVFDNNMSHKRLHDE